MKMLVRVVVLVLVCGGLLSCRSSRQTAAESPELIEARERLAEATDLFRQGDYETARKTLAPLVGKPYYQREVALLNSVLAQKLEKPRVDMAKNFSQARAIGEIGERLILPSTYGETRVISPTTGPFDLPPGPMDELISRKVDINLVNADVRTMLLALSEIDGLNLIADDALTQATDKTLTISVKGVPLKEILSYVSRNMGIAFYLGDNVIWVTEAAAPAGGNGPDLLTRVIHLRTGYTPALGGGGGGGGGGGVGAAAGGGGDALLDALNDFLQDNPNNPPNSKFTLYRDRNILIIRNTRENIRYAEELIRTFDRVPLQVLIEARFITISQDDLLQVGNSINNISYTKKDKYKPLFSATLPAAGEGVSGAPTLKLGGIIDEVTYDTVLTAFAKTSSARTMEAPRITVINNRNAKIFRGDKRYFFENFDVETTGGTDPVTTVVPSGEATELDLGITLEVLPSIGNDLESITLGLNADISDFIEMVSLSPTISMPHTSDQTITTSVTVNSGETLVLGGMISGEETKTTNKVPILGDLPLIGFLFRKEAKEDRPSHLLIFVKAVVIDPDGAFNVAPKERGK